jgi:hypothetical protein
MPKWVESMLGDTGSWRPIALILLLLGGLVGVLVGLTFYVKIARYLGSNAVLLSGLAVGGVIILILLLTTVAAVFGVLGLTNNSQAMGLPEGSIRSVIALSLIVLFAILSVYLYENVQFGRRSTVYLQPAQYAQFMDKHDAAIKMITSALTSYDSEGKPLPAPVYLVEYSTDNPASADDFSKQLLVLLGTLMTAVTSFYLGANTATAAATAAQAASAPSKPSITGVDPPTHSLANGKSLELKILGNDLNDIKHVTLQRPGAQISATVTGSTATSVTCKVDLDTAHVGAAWDVVVDDGASQSAMRPGVLKIDS